MGTVLDGCRLCDLPFACLFEPCSFFSLPKFALLILLAPFVSLDELLWVTSLFGGMSTANSSLRMSMVVNFQILYSDVRDCDESEGFHL